MQPNRRSQWKYNKYCYRRKCYWFTYFWHRALNNFNRGCWFTHLWHRAFESFNRFSTYLVYQGALHRWPGNTLPPLDPFSVLPDPTGVAAWPGYAPSRPRLYGVGRQLLET